MNENGSQWSEFESEAVSIEGMASTSGGHTDHDFNCGDSIQFGVDSDPDIEPMGDSNEDTYSDDDISKHNVFQKLLCDEIDDERAAGDDMVGRQGEYDQWAEDAEANLYHADDDLDSEGVDSIGNASPDHEFAIEEQAEDIEVENANDNWGRDENIPRDNSIPPDDRENESEDDDWDKQDQMERLSWSRGIRCTVFRRIRDKWSLYIAWYVFHCIS